MYDKVLIPWCRGIEEVMDINEYMRKNLSRGRLEILIQDENDKIKWYEYTEINKNYIWVPDLRIKIKLDETGRPKEAISLKKGVKKMKGL